jgi:pilus assembly protein CpaE
VASSRILLVDADQAAAGVIAETLAAVGHTVTTVPDGRAVFQDGGETELIVLDVPAGSTGSLELCREIRATPALAPIPVLCIAQSDDVEARIAFLEVGADDVVAKPFDGRELEARVEALILRFQRSRELAPATTAQGAGLRRRTVAVFSPKGGAGTTTIAANLAAALAQRKPDRVVVVDLDLQFGQVATQFDLEPSLTLVDAIHDETALTDPEALRTYTTRHESGVLVLAGPPDPTAAARIRPDHVGRLLETLLGTFDTALIDAGSTLGPVTLVAFEHAEQIIFPVTPEVPALKALHRLLEHLSTSGAVAAKALYVLNSMYAKELIKQRDVESTLGSSVAAELPYDPFVYLKAVNEGIPVVLGAPKSRPAESLLHLAGRIFPEEAIAATPVVEERRRGLLSLRRR